MKKISLSMLAITLAVSGLFAQDPSGSGDKKKNHSQWGHHQKKEKAFRDDYSKLNLSKEQQDELVKINKDFRSGGNELRKKEATTTVKDYKAQMKALNKKRHDQAQAVFTPEQKDQLVKMRAERKAKFDSTAKDGRRKIKADLNLSEDQSVKMKALREATGKKVKAIKDNSALTEDEKKQQIMAAFKQQREDMKSILTPEQVKKLESGGKHRTRKMVK